MNIPVQFITKNNAVSNIYNNSGIHTPAGLQGVQSPQPEPEPSHMIIPNDDFLTAIGYLDYVGNNPVLVYGQCGICFASDDDYEIDSATYSIDGGEPITHLDLSPEWEDVSSTVSETEYVWVRECSIPADDIASGNHTFVVSFVSGGNTYEISGSFTV